MDTAQLDIFNTQSGVFEEYTQPERLHVIPKEPPKPLVPYSYQKESIDKVYELISKGLKKICLILLMGAGKSAVAGWMLRDAISADKKCIFLVHYDTLIQQSVDEFKRLGLRPSVIKGKNRFNKNADVLVASVQTIEAKLRKGSITLTELIGHRDLIIEDECHELAFRDSRNLFDDAYPQSIFIGLTATPYRLSKREWLGQKYQASVSVIQPPDLIKLGKVLPCRPFELPNVFDTSTLVTKGKDGDYTDASVGKQASTDKVRDFVVEQYLKVCPDSPAIMVGSTVHQAQLQCESFNKAGIPSEVITGTTKTPERQAIFERSRLGITKIICSVGTLTAGVSLNWISCILFVRITKSKARFFQVSGRGARTWPGKDFYWLLDFGNNLSNFGNPMDYQDYSIDGHMPEETEMMGKECPNCGHIQSMFNSECPKCKYQFTQESEEEPELILSDLTEYFDTFTQKKVKQLHDSKRNSFRQFGLNGKVASDLTSPDYAIEQFKQQYGHIPPVEWQLNAVLGEKYSKAKLRDYIAYLKAHIKNPKYAKGWLNYHYRLETGQDMPDNQLDLLLRDVE